MITPTTVGHGPFQPAIKLNGDYRIHPDKFETEDEAIHLARKLAEKLHEEIELIIAQHYFVFWREGEQS